MLYKSIIEKFRSGKKQLGILIDPDKLGYLELIELAAEIESSDADFVLVGGSLVSESLEITITTIKQKVSKPVILFPGSLLQISKSADAIFLLSLISGRNPEFLIGNHVVAAPLLKKSNLEILPTGYIIVGGNETTSVEYISNTMPIPPNKSEIAMATAIAGEMLGLKLIYLETGSGASCPASNIMISDVKSCISVPLIVGGGIKNADQLRAVYKSGADIAIVGTAVETNPASVKEFSAVVSELRGA